MEFRKIKWTAVALVMMAGTVLMSCDKQPIGPTGPDPVGPPPPGYYITLKDFRALYPNTGAFTIPTGTKKFRAAVISNSANEASGNYRLQDESGFGIRLFAASGSPVYAMNSILEVDAAGATLDLYNGDLELKSVPQAKVVPLSGTLPLTARTATVADINTNKDAWSSSLVKISNVTITAGTTNGTGTNYNVTDATGTLTLFVRSASGISVPLGPNHTVTGYVSIFNSSAELGIRSTADIL